MGTPVLITNVCDYPEVEEYDVGRIVELDANQISGALLEILGNKKFLENCSENAKKLINEKFLLSEKIKKYEEMYQKVLKNKDN